MKRWLAAHMLSDLIPGEAVELIVASVFTDPAPFTAPNSVSCNFMRSLRLLSSHDWSRDPLIFDPAGHIKLEERSNIVSAFENSRCPDYKNGPSMFIISPNDFNEEDQNLKPSFTSYSPERVVLSRVCALAKRSYDFLMSNCICNLESSCEHNSWVATFQESSNSLKSYSSLLRVDNELIYDDTCGSTGCDLNTSIIADKAVTPFQRSMQKRSLGPKQLRKKVIKILSQLKTAAVIVSCLVYVIFYFYNIRYDKSS